MRNPVGWIHYEEYFINGYHYKILENSNGDRWRVRYRDPKANRWADLGGRAFSEWMNPQGAMHSILRNIQSRIRP